ncbi:hypothetical protein N3K66_008259 [Trichothecium roseum]|uniref:Uncharacterized protein n=1 Tax=Trichothecium roseum TaxID=47278 RepID=A0ACC0UUQ6_9HYPO|nr:hypothetical protein N3K66_008259 [Trichothecium roseum]
MRSMRSMGSRASGRGKPPTPFWPDEFLRDDLPEARVWTYGYNANVFEGLFAPSNKHGVEQHGDDLAITFGREIENEDPVIWVAHGLGGIIVKDALRKSEVCQARTKKLIFLGTPHRGSKPAGWSKLALGLARLAMQDVNHKLVESLEEDSGLLRAIHLGFVKVAIERGIKVHSFYEGRGPSGLKGFNHKVVEDSSAKANLPQELEVVESLDVSHRGMTRAVDKDDMVYRSILSIIKRFVRPLCPEEEDEKDAQEPEPDPESKPEPEAEPEAEAEPESEPKLVLESEPGPELQPEAKSGPEPASATDVLGASKQAEPAAGDEPDPKVAYTVAAAGAQDQPSVSTPRSTNWEVLVGSAEAAADELDDQPKGEEGDKSSPSVALGNEQNTKQEDVSVPTIKIEDADALKA